VSEPTASLDQALAHASRLMATDPALAGAQASEILKVAHGHPMALLLLAVSRSACGDGQAAADILHPLVRAEPRWAEAQLELGLALGRLGQGEDALRALRQAVALKPDLPRAWRAIGDHLSAIGDAEGADRAYASHVRHSTRDPGLLAAGAALADGRVPEAEALLRDRLRRTPTDVAAIRMLAEVAARLGRDEDAARLLERCLELAPSFHAARHHYAIVLNRAERAQEALAQVDRLLAHDPANAGYRNQRAAILCRLGDYTPALAIYADLVVQYANHAGIWLSYGHALKTAGRQADAITAYRRAIAADAAFGEAYWSLANLKTFRFDDADLDAMRAQLARTDLGEAHRLHFDFALGKALEDRAEHAASFVHYARGNALRRGQVRYDADENAARLQRSRDTFDAAFFAERAGAGADADDPIFVVGLPRAGSTLIEQILSSHPQVEGTMELPEIIALTRELRQRGAAPQSDTYHEVLAGLDPGALRALGERYLARTRVHRKLGAPRFIDKMPNNFAHVGLIQLVLPNARIIDARRHPMACCFSAFKQHFARGQHFSYDLREVGRYYRDYVGLMAHWDAVLPGRVHRVLYERMVEDTEGEVRALLDYCGLPFDPACLRFFENARPVRTASSEQVRQPIYKDGVDQWRHYEPWLGPLRDALGPVLDQYPGAPPDAGRRPHVPSTTGKDDGQQQTFQG
jgi:tetratricopeptide (TPR) repeat protein